MMRHIKRKICIMTMVSVLAVALTGCSSVNPLEAETDGVTIEGTYQIAVPSGNEDATNLTYTFDSESKTYKETLPIEDTETTLMEGSYSVEFSEDGSAELVLLDADGEASQTFLVYEDYLVEEDLLYTGEEISSFRLSGTYENEASGGYITFDKSGSFEDDTYTGTYKVKGHFITRNADDGTSLVDLLILDQGLSNSYLIKQGE